MYIVFYCVSYVLYTCLKQHKWYILYHIIQRKYIYVLTLQVPIDICIPIILVFTRKIYSKCIWKRWEKIVQEIRIGPQSHRCHPPSFGMSRIDWLAGDPALLGKTMSTLAFHRRNPPSPLPPSFLSTLPVSLGIEIPLPIARLLPVHPPRLPRQPPPHLHFKTWQTNKRTDISVLYL